MKRNKILSLLLSVAVLGSTLPTVALADDTATTRDKTVPGWVDENNGHPKQIQKTFDFVVDNIAYSKVEGGVEVSPWYWEWDHSCNSHTETVFCGSEYTGDTITIPANVTYGEETYNVVGIGDSAFWNATRYTVSFPNSEYFTYIGDQVFFQTSPNMESITIPASVTHIGKKSFALNEDSIPVTIPEDSKLEVIGDQAFANNSAITALDLPDTLTTIGSQAFSNCTSLTSITIPASVTTMETETFDGFYDPNANDGAGNVSFADSCIFKIQDGVFYDDENLIRVLDWQENVVVPEGIKYIGAGAFDTRKVTDQATTLKSISFPSTLESIGKDAFLGNKSLEEVVIPERVTEIDSGAFQQCTGLKKADINANISALSSALFNGCSSLAEVELPNTVKTIESQAFNGCTGLTDIILPTGLETIGNRAFFQCKSLKTVVIPDGVTTISDQVFGNCKSIETVILPASVETVGKQAFQGAFNSESATFIMLGDNPPSNFNVNAFGTSENNRPNEANFTVIIPAGSEAAYAASTGLSDYVIQDGEVGTKPGISYSLSIPATASVYTGNTTTLAVTSTIPTGATLEVTSSNDAATASLSGDNRTIAVTGVSDGTATITVAMKLNGTTLTSKSCTVTVTTYNPPSGGGGGSSDPTYSISLPGKVTGGEVSIQKRYAEKGETVTITVTPDDGYELDELIVTDSKGNKLDLTDKGNGKFTFKMPAGRVEIEVSFQEIVIEPGNPFVDVSTSDYYYDAVLWAVENGVTNGTSATTFGPNMAVSRAQMVTFLWRAHGSPKATGTNPFTDVSTSDYYYDAVLWAVANGVTNGTSATTFSPDTAVTRSQAVTFQWRAAGSPVVSGSSFGDVATDAYYVNAVTWAVANGITNGTGGNTFSPDVVVSRAQAVTFLYREQE